MRGRGGGDGLAGGTHRDASGRELFFVRKPGPRPPAAERLTDSAPPDGGMRPAAEPRMLRP
jgi:hypothetical protein